MNLIVVWVSFIIWMSTSHELNLVYYFIYNFWLLLLTYLYNRVTPSKISFNTFLLLSSFSSFVIFYIILIYENFLFISIFIKLLIKIETPFLNIYCEETFLNYVVRLPARFSNSTNITRFYKF